jgi:hypothetical protein
MIAKRYGKRIQSVDPDFSAVAMTEIMFRRGGDWEMDAAEFEAAYRLVREEALVASGEGDVQTDVENGILDTLLADLRALQSAVGEGDILVVENESGRDYPKLHSTQRTVVVGFENRLHFTYRVDPPLRIGIYRPASA